MLSPKAIAILQDIQQILEVPHTAQELLSSERTPTLPMALPAYEELAVKWRELQGTIWELSHYISIGLEKLEQYRNEGRKTRIYALSMSMWTGYFCFCSLITKRIDQSSIQAPNLSGSRTIGQIWMLVKRESGW